MTISEINISILLDKSDNGLVGFASIIIADAIRLSSIGIFTNPKSEIGYRLTYPIRKNTRQDLNYFFPINKEIYNQIEYEVVKKYKELIEESK